MMREGSSCGENGFGKGLRWSSCFVLSQEWTGLARSPGLSFIPTSRTLIRNSPQK